MITQDLMKTAVAPPGDVTTLLSRLRGPACLLALGLDLTLGCASTQAGPSPPPKKYEAPDERFVFFAHAKADVLSDGYFNIGYITALLDVDTSLHVLIIGHADQNARGAANRDISLRRARAVRKVLLDHGIKGSRVLVAAPREQSESTLAQLNRRADLILYDPLQDEASKRLGYEIEIKPE